MSLSDPTDHARGWLYAEGLLLEDTLARLEKMSEEDLDAELRGSGIDPDRVPGLEALLAKAGALARRKERGEVDHARGWAHVESLLAEEEAAARDVERVPSMERLVARAAELARQPAPRDGEARAVEAQVPETGLAAKWGPPVRRLRRVWLVAAGLGALLLVFAVVNRAAIVAVFKGEEIGPDDRWLPWKPAPTPEERAAPVRDQAFAACDVGQWETCGARLDEARRIDPAGESAPRVTAARKAVADAARPPGPTPPREPLKPRPSP